jgi:hypothetical protein
MEMMKKTKELLTFLVDSVAHCPVSLRQIFNNLQEEVVKKFPEIEDLRYTCVSGYLFLRFFAAAILGPKLFGLCADHPSQKNSRTLTLISKTVQQLANLLLFDGKVFSLFSSFIFFFFFLSQLPFFKFACLGTVYGRSQ